MNTDKSKLEAQKENFAEKKVNKISSNLPVIKSVCEHETCEWVRGITMQCCRCGKLLIVS